MSYSKTILVGHLGHDPEIRYTPSQLPVCTLSVATRHQQLVNGESQEQTEWHRVVVFGKQAEASAKYLAKGREVCVDGRNRTRQYDKDGVTHYTTEIIAERVKFLGSAKKDVPASHPEPDLVPTADLLEMEFLEPSHDLA